MADLDTQAKRASSISTHGYPWMLAPILPDGDLDEVGDRAHMTGGYSALVEETPPGGAGNGVGGGAYRHHRALV